MICTVEARGHMYPDPRLWRLAPGAVLWVPMNGRPVEVRGASRGVMQLDVEGCELEIGERHPSGLGRVRFVGHAPDRRWGAIPMPAMVLGTYADAAMAAIERSRFEDWGPA